MELIMKVEKRTVQKGMNILRRIHMSIKIVDDARNVLNLENPDDIDDDIDYVGKPDETDDEGEDQSETG